MKSIRLSLMVYFLLLLAVALGAVSWFSYQNSQQALHDKEAITRQTLQAKEASTRAFLENQYNDNRKRIRDNFDRELLAKASHLEPLAVWVNHQQDALYPLGYFGLVGNTSLPFRHLTSLFWVAASTPSKKQDGVMARVHWIMNDIRIVAPDEEAMTLDEGRYFQTYRWKGPRLERSDTLEVEDVWLNLDDDLRLRAEQAPQYDDVEIRAGEKVRRVTVKMWTKRSRTGVVMVQRPAFKFPSKGPPSGGRGFPPRPGVPFFVQYASETSQRDRPLGVLEQERIRDLAKLESETRQTLDDLEEETRVALGGLRKRMLWIGLGTFAALVFGSFWLVRLGLSPLKRLSEAVSRVSPRDFRLPLDPAQLPKELQPIAMRVAETLEQLKRAFGREKQAAADISHELRTPLATLLTTLDVALNKPRSPEEYRETLEDCRLAGQQMTHLVERLLALARLDAGADPLRPRDVDVAYLARQCADLVRPLAHARGLKLQVHAQGPATLRADPDKIREVLTNLLHNAIEYNRPEGSVELAVERQNGQLCLEVRDTGIGIAPEVREHIFERFFRADPSRNPEGLHAGLGLAIVKGYIDLMGGTIRVDSNERGSTFHVELPVKGDERFRVAS